MKTFNLVRNFLKGKKAYIVGFLMVVLGVWAGNGALAMEGLAVLALRAGIKKLE
jgi:hypothetical protein